MSSAEGYALALGEPPLGLQLPPFSSPSVQAPPPHRHAVVFVVPLLPYRSASSFLELAVAPAALGEPSQGRGGPHPPPLRPSRSLIYSA